MKKQTVVGMSGHIDHGKTSIVKALTGKDTDVLSQEKERGMTIDIGFAHLSEDITIIDVPGHEKFIKNMVTGVNYIDIAVLAIAADDGVMPQTKEHFEILKILNIKNGIIVINKIDLAEKDWIDLVESDIKELVKDSFLESQPILKISTLNGIGIDSLRDEIVSKSSEKKDSLKNNRGLFRMYIDRCFSQQGFGTVVTGTVISGSIDVGNKINVLPGNYTARLRTAQSHHSSVNTLNIGDRAALNLHGIEKKQIERGSHLSNQDSFSCIDKFIANISILENTNITIKQNQRLRFHIGTSEVIGRVSICDKNSINSGDSSACLIKLEKATIVAFQDDFLIRTYSPMRTVGGGIVEDISCLGKWKDVKEYSLKLISNNTIAEKIFFIIEKQLGRPFNIEDIQSRFGMSFEKIVEYIDYDKNYKILEYLNEKWIVTDNQLESFFQTMLDVIKKFHVENPYKMGILKKQLYQRLYTTEIFLDFCINELLKRGNLVQKKELITLKNFKIDLSDNELIVMNKIISILDEQGFSSQNHSELADSLKSPLRKLNCLLISQRKIKRLSD